MVTYRMIVTTLANFRVNRSRNFDVDGFRDRWKKQVEKVQPGDKFLYYITKIQKIGAISEAISTGYYDEKTKVWTEKKEIWPCRFNTRPLLVLDEANMLDLKRLVPQLTFISDKQKETAWTIAFQQSLKVIPKNDFDLIESEMKKLESSQSKVTRSTVSMVKDAPMREISTHSEIVRIMENIGKSLGYITEREKTISEYRHDIVWKKKQFLSPSFVIEVCDGGSLEKDILSLGWANENLEATPILIVTKENDFAQAKRRMPSPSKIVVVKAEYVKILGELVQNDTSLLKAIFQ